MASTADAIGPNRIAIVEDDGRLRRMLERQIRRWGYDPVMMTAPEEYEREIAALTPDFLLLDLHLGKRDGFELLHKLAAQRCDARVILMSGSDEKLLQVALEVGEGLGLRMSGILAKPIMMETLHSMLTEIEIVPKLRESTSCTLNENDLFKAVSNNELVVYFQPEIELDTRRFVGMEALLRWHHPQFGILPPSEFIHLSLTGKAAEVVSRYVINRAIAVLAEIDRPHYEQLNVAVNVPAFVLESEDFVSQVAQSLREHDIKPQQLIIEVVETGLVEVSTAMQRNLGRLRLAGVEIAADDFGTGLSSLKRLTALPFTMLKLDKSFVQRLLHHQESRLIVEQTLRLAEVMQLKAVAEGIEDQSTYDALTELGCAIGQGYLMARPMPEPELRAWVARWGVENGARTVH